MKRRNSVLAVLMLGAVVSNVFADENPTNIYPFVPMSVKEIYNDVERVTEDKNFIKNFYDIIEQKLSKKKTKVKPWSSSYWPLGKGTIADPYEDSKVSYYVEYIRTHTGVWKHSLDDFKKRKKKLLNDQILEKLTNKELEKLAPSEKYDILLGDFSFDLTNRQMEYMGRYGADNHYGSLDKIYAAGDDTLSLAELYVSWGWYKTPEDAFRIDSVLNKRIDAQRAVSLVDSGDSENIEDAWHAVKDHALAEAKNYVIDEPLSTDIAGWEGICNGWSTAAGIIPRPRKAVTFNLGKRSDGSDIIIKFFPSDIKGLVSQLWFNSSIQDSFYVANNGKPQGGTILVGNRCNTDAEEDAYGRLYDVEKDPYSRQLEPRCVGVHPAKWHMGLVNLIGKQGRSFVVERKVDSPVDNHPMYSYEMKYFNPNDGKEYKDIRHNIEEITEEDQFYSNRNPKAKYVVGVETTMTYLDYMKPNREETDDEKDDSEVDKTMLYDLELDADYNIVGGQWRAKYAGKILRKKRPGSKIRQKEKRNHNQPDFFWVVSKRWKETGYFNNWSSVAKWEDKTQAPPASWIDTAKKTHDMHAYESTYNYKGKLCDVKNPNTGDKRTVWCGLKTNKPQPMSNVVNTLIELSSGKSFSEL